MHRRSFLAHASIAAVGIGATAGCVDRAAPTDGGTPANGDGSTCARGDDAALTEWTHPVGGSVTGVAHGHVIGVEDFAQGDGGVYCLDGATGDHRWTYGETDGFHMFTATVDDDAIVLGFADDAIGSGTGRTIALESDGTERWTRSTGSVYDPPTVAEGTVYVADDAGVVSAFDLTDGERRWSTDDFTPYTPRGGRVVGVGDALYVAAGQLLAIDRDHGEIAWRFGAVEDGIDTAIVDGDDLYLADGAAVVAVADGEERWTAPFESTTHPRAVIDDRVVVDDGRHLRGLDEADGDERWSVEYAPASDRGSAMAVDDGAIYVGASRLTAIDATDGTVRWRESIDDVSTIRSVGVEHCVAGDPEPSLFVRAAAARLLRLDLEGSVVWETTLDEPIGSLRVDGFAFVATPEAIRSLDPRD